uniref:C-type lectin domain-containing protein n=1 Tax=Anabas testudineus TaxID=64144 RepID=A0A3Q1H9T8_ANATE
MPPFQVINFVSSLSCSCVSPSLSPSLCTFLQVSSAWSCTSPESSSSAQYSCCLLLSLLPSVLFSLLFPLSPTGRGRLPPTMSLVLHYDNCNLYSNLLKVDTCPKCEEGWELHGGKCYYFSTTNQPGTRAEMIKSLTQSISSTLPVQSFLELTLRQKMDSDYDKFWIGLTDSKEEGKWLWVDDSPLNTRNGEVPEGEDCAAMGKKSGAADLKCWFDIFCKKNYKSICEKSAETGRVTCV